MVCIGEMIEDSDESVVGVVGIGREIKSGFELRPLVLDGSEIGEGERQREYVVSGQMQELEREGGVCVADEEYVVERDLKGVGEVVGRPRGSEYVVAGREEGPGGSGEVVDLHGVVRLVQEASEDVYFAGLEDESALLHFALQVRLELAVEASGALPLLAERALAELARVDAAAAVHAHPPHAAHLAARAILQTHSAAGVGAQVALRHAPAHYEERVLHQLDHAAASTHVQFAEPAQSRYFIRQVHFVYSLIASYHILHFHTVVQHQQLSAFVIH